MSNVKNKSLFFSTDEDECTLNLDNCLSGLSNCLNGIGTFSCECVNGYEGDGVSNCTGICLSFCFYFLPLSLITSICYFRRSLSFLIVMPDITTIHIVLYHSDEDNCHFINHLHPEFTCRGVE